MQILIRFDDICPTMDWGQWERAVAVLEQYHVRPLLGVVPCCEDPDLLIDAPRPDFWAYIRQLQDKGYAIAMHGYKHLLSTKPVPSLVTNGRSEFAGLSLAEQTRMIAHGKNILQSHGITTNIFFAPAHSYDQNTLRALAACGFRYVSDSKSCRAYDWHGIRMLPCRSSGDTITQPHGHNTLVYHAHEWTRPDKAAGFQNLQNKCARYASHIVDFPTYAQQPTGHTTLQRADEQLYVWANQHLRPIASKIKHNILKR